MRGANSFMAAISGNAAPAHASVLGAAGAPLAAQREPSGGASALKMLGHMVSLWRQGDALPIVTDSSFLRDNHDIGQVRKRMEIAPIKERYVGEWMRHAEGFQGRSTAELCDRQRSLQQLYETRFASLQRLVAFFVLFHAMGKRVQNFWPAVSFGLLGYDMSRSQSMLRVATTASPISGSEVRSRILLLRKHETQNWAARAIQRRLRRLRWAAAVRRGAKRMSTPPAGDSIMVGTGTADSMQLATELLRQLPDHYLTSTTVDERRAHLELYSQFKMVLVGSGRRREDVYMDWKPQQKTVLLHLVFFDFTGSLNTVTATLAARSIDIVRVAAFGTRGGVALDTFEVSSFDEDAALLLKARFKMELDRLEAADVAGDSIRQTASPGLDLQSTQAMLEFPESYVQSTTPDERQMHAALFRDYEEQARRQQAGVNLQMSWACNAANTQVALHLLFPTCASLLGPTITLLQASSVSISAVASFSTSSNSFSILILHVAPDFNDQVAQKLRAHLANVLASADNATGTLRHGTPWDTSAALSLLADMPDNCALYVACRVSRCTPPFPPSTLRLRPLPFALFASTLFPSLSSLYPLPFTLHPCRCRVDNRKAFTLFPLPSSLHPPPLQMSRGQQKGIGTRSSPPTNSFSRGRSPCSSLGREWRAQSS